MSNMKVKWFDRVIWLDEIYYVYFSDKKRKMTKKKLEEYNKINSWPEKLKWRHLTQMNPADNPKVTPMTGRQVIEASEAGYIPQFDMFFDQESCENYAGGLAKKPQATRRLTLIPAAGMEYILSQKRLLKGR